MDFIVYSYVGFGDHCICYGIIKEFAKQYDKIIYRSDAMHPTTFKNCKRLFANIPNVELVEEPIEIGVTHFDHVIAHTGIWFDQLNPWLKDPSVPYACNLPIPEWYNETYNFDRQWYMNAAVSYELKWENFNFKRNKLKEKEVYYDILGLKDSEKYIFLSEDIYRGYSIDRKYINSDMKIVDFHHRTDVDILDILHTVEHAQEVHTINSALLTFVDLMNIKHDKLYYHKYNRSCFWDQPGLRLNWHIIE